VCENLFLFHVSYMTPLTVHCQEYLAHTGACFHSLEVGLLKQSVHQLQRVPDTAVRHHTCRYTLVVHWQLPIYSHIQYNLCSLVFDINRGTSPSYMLLMTLTNVSGSWRFHSPRDTTITFRQMFAVAGPKACSALPFITWIIIT